MRLSSVQRSCLEVVQQLTTLVNHANQTTTAMVVMNVALEVTLQTFDVRSQQRDLNFSDPVSFSPRPNFSTIAAFAGG